MGPIEDPFCHDWIAESWTDRVLPWRTWTPPEMHGVWRVERKKLLILMGDDLHGGRRSLGMVPRLLGSGWATSLVSFAEGNGLLIPFFPSKEAVLPWWKAPCLAWYSWPETDARVGLVLMKIKTESPILGWKGWSSLPRRGLRVTQCFLVYS